MPIYINDNEAKVYKGDHAPINVYLGENKLEGWHEETATGVESFSPVGTTYNDEVEVEVLGNTVQTSDYYAKDGLLTQTSDYYAKDGAVSQYADTKVMGKNLLNPDKNTYTAYGITVENLGGGEYLLNGTTTSPVDIELFGNTSNTYLGSVKTIPVVANDIVYGYFEVVSGTCSQVPAKNFTFISNEDVKIGNFLGITGVSYASGSIVVPSTGVISRFRITALSTGSIFNNYKIRFWLSKNQTCATFEPYKDTVKSGLVMELSGRNFFNEPKTVTLQDRSGNGNNGTASGFQYRTQEYADKLSDFAGKVTGSFVENPNKAKVTISSALPTPSQTWGEISTAEYTKINSLNAVSYASGNTIVSGMMALQLFSFNLIEIFERQYGMMPCVDQSLAGKVAWLKANISNLDCSWHGYGSCPTGNKATFTKWNAESSIWSTTVASHNYNTVSLLTQHMVQPYLTSVITNDGFAHYLAYTDASDGVTASTIYTDYISLTLKFKPAGGSDGSGGIKFDGVDDKITVNHLIPAKPFTISSWVYTTSTDAQCLYCNRLSAGAGIAIFRLSASGGIRFDTGGQQWTFAYVLPLNTWVHLTFQISDSEKKLFVNGILHSSIAFTDPITNTSSVVATIGVAHINGASFEYYFKGTLDRFTIYNRALSASEVYQNYFAGVNLNVPSPTDASPVVSNLPANTYKITLPNAEIYEFTLPEELRGIGTEVDKVTFDRVSKKGFVERRIKVFVADGTKTYATLNPLTLSKEARCTTLNDNKGQFILSTKFKMVANTWDKDDLYTCSNAGVSYTQIAYRIPINDDATTFFTNNPTTTYYATNVPTCTPLTFTKVTTSTATEVPMAFLTNVPDPLHPAQIVSNLPAN